MVRDVMVRDVVTVRWRSRKACSQCLGLPTRWSRPMRGAHPRRREPQVSAQPTSCCD